MAAVYLGGGTVAASVPGLSAAFSTIGSALTDLHGVVSAQLGTIADVATQLGAQADLVTAASIAIRIPAVLEFEAQLTAALDLSASFSIQAANPAAYLSGLLDALIDVQSALVIALPSLQIDAQAAASAALAVDFGLKIAAVDLQLAALASISAILDVLAAAALSANIAIGAAIAAVSAALTAYADMTSAMAAAGVHSFLYTGALSGLGAAIDAVTAPIVLVATSDGAALDGVNAVFRVS